MSKPAQRILIPLVIGAVALGIVVLVILNPRNRGVSSSDSEVRDQSSEVGDQTSEVNDDAGPEGATPEGPGAESGDDASEQDAGDDETVEQDGGVAASVMLTGLRAVAPAAALDDSNPADTIGSLDRQAHRFLIEFSSAGAGVERVTFSDIWETAEAKRQAADLWSKVESGEMTLAAALDAMPAARRYVIQQPRTITFGGVPYSIAAFALDSIYVTTPGSAEPPQQINLGGRIWSQDGPVDPDRRAISFSTEIHNDAGEPILRIRRTYGISPDAAYDITLAQSVENLSTAPLSVTLYSWGMSDIAADRSQYIDIRRFRIGHLLDTVRYPERQWVETDEDLFLDRGDVIALGQRNHQYRAPANALWPNETSRERNYELTWLALENRYFAVAAHPPYSGGTIDTSLADAVEAIDPFADSGLSAAAAAPFFLLRSPARTIAAGENATFNLGIYAGPLDRSILTHHEPYDTLRMSRLIFYQISSWCGWCTFQWLAVLLLWFLSVGHSIFADWGVAIILLVVVVRLALHPITKKSQVSMQRFGKVMQKLKPDIEKLQEKYKSDPKRLQQEQMKLWKEYGVSPFSCLGFLPIFLQMPIWIALYAMLYFAWELRHEAAFWGVFQLFWDWPFLRDLSSGDHFFYEFDEPVKVIWWTLTGINLLPILMGAIFWVQQKYMTPQMANLSPEQKQMQTMMRIMTVFLFPIMLYTAPSGLTLYIMTSSIWGIIESRMVRRHVEKMEIAKPIERKSLEERLAAKAGKKGRDPYSRAMQMAMDRAKAKREAKEKKTFKKRK
jgi:YidC/Oxa1 family membrane protein insertase